jgi:quercetin dioxygenase-like cupin family protein
VSEAVLVPSGGGEVVGDSAVRRVEILSDDDTLHTTWSRFGPHREGAVLHVHRHHTDLFYVLAGELTVRLGLEDEAVVAPAGTLARVPPLVVHGFRNDSADELRFLNLHAPGEGFADYMRAVRDGRDASYDQHPPPPDGGRPKTEAVIGEGFVDVEAIGIAEIRLEPGDPAPPAHVHERHVESFYVVEGELTFTAGGRELRAEAGSWVQIPRGVPHTYAFPGPARFLNVHTPSCGLGALDQVPA